MRHLCPWRPKQSEEEPVIAVNLNQAIQILLSVHQVHIHCHSNRPTVMRVFLRGHQPLKGATKEWLLLIFHIASELDQASKFISVDSLCMIVYVSTSDKQHARRHASCTWAQLEWKTAPGQRTISKKAAEEQMVWGMEWTTHLDTSWIRPTIQRMSNNSEGFLSNLYITIFTRYDWPSLAKPS